MLNIGMGRLYHGNFLYLPFHIRVPEPAADFVDSMGNAAVPLSMMTVGIMVAQSDLKSLVTDKKQLLFAFISLLVIPAVCIPFMRMLPVDKVSYGNFYSFVLQCRWAAWLCWLRRNMAPRTKDIGQKHCFDLHPVRAHHSCDYISGMTGDG